MSQTTEQAVAKDQKTPRGNVYEEYKSVAQAWEDFVDATSYNEFIWGLMQRLKKVLAVLTKIASNKAIVRKN